MSRQLLIENFYKKKGSASKTLRTDDSKDMSDMGKILKRRNLSLNKPTTPTKSPKVNGNKNVGDVIDLCSDDEDIWESPRINVSQGSTGSEASKSTSSGTITYSLTPGTPKKTLESTQSQNTCQTPQKTPSGKPGNSSHLIKYQSPTSNKFFSPTKHRAVFKRSPGKVKRNLSPEMSNSADIVEDERFTVACDGLDDKTIFLLTIINKCLKDELLSKLLDPINQGVLANCLRVMKPGMKLVCRLFWRKEGWYRIDQLRTIIEGKELDEKETKHQAMMTDDMLESLLDNGLLETGHSQNMSFEDFTTLLSKDELVQICKDLKVKHCNNKQKAIAALASYSKSSNISKHLIIRKSTGYVNPSSNSSRVLQMMHNKTPSRYRLSELARTTIQKLHVLMYLGIDYSLIREKKLELMLICEKVKRETYPVDESMVLDNASIVFRDSKDFERYMSAHLLQEEFLTKSDVHDRCHIVRRAYGSYNNIAQQDMEWYTSLPLWLRRFTPAYIYIKILEAGIQDLKKMKNESDFELALDILNALISQTAFRQHKKADWYSEKALILQSNKFFCNEAAEVLIEGFKSDLSEEAKDSMRKRARKLANQKNISLSEHLKTELLEHATKDNILENNFKSSHIDKQPMDRINKRGKVKFETRTLDGRVVQDAEEYCIAHYTNSGDYTHGEHWEGRIVTTIFFLLFWNIIYSKPAGARGIFLTRYQVYPLDMFCDGFYENRRTEIDRWLKVIEDASINKLLDIMYDTWNSRPEYELSGIHRKMNWLHIAAVASCLGPAGLAAVCRRLAGNYHYAHSGFPDLTLWNETTRKIMFVEVKTDADKPSIKQIQWMEYLRENNIEVEFCYIGANTTRQRSRCKKSPATKKSLNIKTEVKIESPK